VDEVTQLALAARDGDRVALSAFIRATQAEVWRLCAHLVHPGDADDLTQDVYVRALGALPAFRGDSSARTWLLSIARRTAIDQVRRRQRRRRIEARLRPAPDVEDHAPVLELNAVIALLPADRREAFLLTQVVGLTYAEAAEVAGCEVGTIRSRVARARAQLVAGLTNDAAPPNNPEFGQETGPQGAPR
jgi:RNA polymerase sigma-70 factor (ECF subfamily)